MKTLRFTTFGQGPRLVLLPGWAMHSRVWGKLVDCLATDFRLTLVDPPGHGLSPPWPKWTLTGTAQALADLLAEPALWLGWSLGGQVVLELALRFPAQVLGLVLVATNPRFIADHSWPGMALEVFESFAQEVDRDAQVAIQRFLTLCCLGTKVHSCQLKRALERFPLPAPRVLKQGLEILRSTDLRPKLAEITRPCLVVGGREDRLVPVAAIGQLAGSLPKAQLVILEGAGHVPFLTHPQEFAALVREFLF